MGVRNDDFGSGKFKARRTNAAGKVYPHSGTDYLCVPGQAVVAPISARYIRAARPYADSELYSGAVFISDDIEIKIGQSIEIDGNLGGDEPGRYAFYSREYYFDSQQYEVEASSVLENKKSSYGAANVKGFNQKTAWVEGAKKSGIGEGLTLTISPPVHLSHLGIMPGYFKSKKRYYQNNRVARIKIELNGRHTIKATLHDDYHRLLPGNPKAHQFISLKDFTEKIKTIEVTIDKVYRGTTFDDTCIGSIVLRKQLKKRPEAQMGR